MTLRELYNHCCILEKSFENLDGETPYAVASNLASLEEQLAEKIIAILNAELEYDKLINI